MIDAFQRVKPSTYILVLLIPPHLKESGLHKDKLSFWIFLKFGNHTADDVLNAGSLYIVFISVEVLIYRLQPADVVMRMVNNVHIDCIFLSSLATEVATSWCLRFRRTVEAFLKQKVTIPVRFRNYIFVEQKKNKKKKL